MNMKRNATTYLSRTKSLAIVAQYSMQCKVQQQTPERAEISECRNLTLQGHDEKDTALPEVI